VAGNVHIGTSGWHYKHWRGPFYPSDMAASKMLSYYIRFFDTVEINNSFYRLPSETTFENWRDSTPSNFCFAVKGSRWLTHMKKLKEPEEGLANLIPRVEVLGDKLGPILFQLPPMWNCNLERLSNFLAALPKEHRYSFEMRNPTWNNQEVYDLLRRYNVAYCIYELAGFQSPIDITADFTYIRLHGPQGAYQGSYDSATLAVWAGRIKEWQKSLKEIYIYFDNDQEAFAVHNALQLKKVVCDRWSVVGS
jgi:uncharacterized protein YecE (DUF72 family)